MAGEDQATVLFWKRETLGFESPDVSGLPLPRAHSRRNLYICLWARGAFLPETHLGAKWVLRAEPGHNTLRRQLTQVL